MTQQRDIDQILDQWFSDGPIVVPDRVIDVVADRIERQRQRPARRLPGRHIAMHPSLKLGFGLAAVLAVVVVGYALLPRSSTGIGTPAAPTPSPAITATPSSAAPASAAADPSASIAAGVCDHPGCAGPLLAGDHQSVNLRPVLSFTTPDGWANTSDLSATYRLDPVGRGGAPVATASFINVWTDVTIADMKAETCDASPRPGAGTAVADWINAITTNPRLTTSASIPIKLGAWSGQSIDVSVAPGWTTPCPGLGYPVVQFILNSDPSAASTPMGVATGSRMHLVILDVGGRTVIASVHGPADDAGFLATMSEVQPIFDSMRFTPGG
jgi:hypothetical protein